MFHKPNVKLFDINIFWYYRYAVFIICVNKADFHIFLYYQAKFQFKNGKLYSEN